MDRLLSIIIPTDIESDLIRRFLGIKSIEPMKPVKKGNVVFIISGTGKVNSAIAATMITERFSPHIIISSGTGGAYPSSGLKIGEIAIAEKEIYGDEGVMTEKGFHDMRYLGIPLIKKRKNLYNELPVSTRYMNDIKKAINRLGLNHRTGTFVTLSTITGTDEMALEIERRISNPVCENMEGAAIAHVALIKGCEFIELRGISNIVQRRDKRTWRLREASINSQNAVIELIRMWYNL